MFKNRVDIQTCFFVFSERLNIQALKTLGITSRVFVQMYVDGAGEGIRTPASTKPTSYLAVDLAPHFLISRLAR